MAKPLRIEFPNVRDPGIYCRGGAAIGVMTEAMLRYSGADLAVLRDGESVFPQIIETLSDGGCRSDIQNVAWIENGRSHAGQLRKHVLALRPVYSQRDHRP
jgi:radical SAM superfamily enzyme YgiQ (UPF0313 family)